MNKRVIQVLILLLWGFLALFAVMKLFFAEQFIAVISNERIIYIGNCIDNNIVLKILSNTTLGLLGMQFYLCSCKQVWRLPFHHYAWLAVYTLALNIGYEYNSTITAVIDLLGFLIVPFILKANWKQTILIFIVHQLGQLAILLIRSESIYLYETNYATRFLLLFDAYIWLILYYLYSNLYKEKTLWECLGFPFSAISRMRNSKKNSQK